MQLRRLASKLRNRDWASVGIEIVIVVVGVLIALQVSNWNDDRKDHLRGDENLARMQSELADDVERLAEISVFWVAVNEQGMAALAHAEQGTLYKGSAWKTLLAYYQASQIWPYRKDDTTFQEIRASGEFGLIQDPALRTRISSHYAGGAISAISEVLGLVPVYREQVRGMTPWALQQYIWQQCYASESESQTLVDCDSPVSEAEAQAVLDEYGRSPELLRHLRFWMAINSLGVGMLAEIRDDASALAREIEANRRR